MNQATSWLRTPWFWLGAGLGLALTPILAKNAGLAFAPHYYSCICAGISIGKKFLPLDWLELPDLSGLFWVRGTIHSFTSDSNSSHLKLRKVTILNHQHDYDFL